MTQIVSKYVFFGFILQIRRQKEEENWMKFEFLAGLTLFLVPSFDNMSPDIKIHLTS